MTTCATVLEPAVTVAPDVAVADLFGASAESATALAVVDEDGRLRGVIPRVTLLAALGAGPGQADVTETVLATPSGDAATLEVSR